MPKTKKPADSSSSYDSDSGPDDRNPPPTKKTKDDSGKSKPKAATGGGRGGGDPPNQWTLEKMRQVRINEFRGRKMVDIREFYEKNGETLPGKKGISLSKTQWERLLEVADEVSAALNS